MHIVYKQTSETTIYPCVTYMHIVYETTISVCNIYAHSGYEYNTFQTQYICKPNADWTAIFSSIQFFKCRTKENHKICMQNKLGHWFNDHWSAWEKGKTPKICRRPTRIICLLFCFCFCFSFLPTNKYIHLIYFFHF